MHLHYDMLLDYSMHACIHTDQLQKVQGESPDIDFQPSTKKQIVERSEGNLSIEVPENPISKFMWMYTHTL